ncbi:MAG: glycosyltransferase family 2 protein [bacterium]|nr:glycosyltransferase family 2 protein [bacterium]
MRCPKLSDLPPLSSGETGWPWDEECEQLPGTMPGGKSWPRIGIVTPSYNQGRFIEETIRSVLLQGYPCLDYVIMDGGSSDQSVEIIKKYEPWLKSWKSGPDQGQTHAINEGWEKLEVDILAWLNSDDVYLPDALKKAARYLSDNPEAVLAYGDALYIDENGKILLRGNSRDFDPRELLLGHKRNYIPQPAVFLRSEIVKKVGELDEAFDFAMDSEFWLRIGFEHKVKYLRNEWLAKVRKHQETKTTRCAGKAAEEYVDILNKYSKYLTQADDLPKYQEVLSEANYSAGNQLCLRGETGKGRKYFVQSLKIRPLRFKPFIAWFLSLAGSRGYRNLIEFYRLVKYRR